MTFNMQITKLEDGILVESDLTELEIPEREAYKVLKAMVVTAAAVTPYLPESSA